jgi:hypothetical protein
MKKMTNARESVIDCRKNIEPLSSVICGIRTLNTRGSLNTTLPVEDLKLGAPQKNTFM